MSLNSGRWEYLSAWSRISEALIPNNYVAIHPFTGDPFEITESAIWLSQIRKLTQSNVQIGHCTKRQLGCSKARAGFKKRHLAPEVLIGFLFSFYRRTLKLLVPQAFINSNYFIEL
ncbi:hypothetical protein PHYBLDRAFT_60139 [Phycomyces blakesleeanus NRRL 1555(-)]|uniref:Uncharacterized protein n=1 Tax=Phycomyces blakesleeanus (strain ATCC 8743b / DSM 1359 / FGSC 10004 / NBRC 33097 / NRRL 1555) TaxID=763407 RepID=A0A167LDW2_PHYB8|nr:hypothetical protein PHYBLDRAFT_60139 [Phycomyces blakesleeanus NRRL 1555(-)]OAD70237.1 hypothetical protein PHYBLDRAFT_60139 [Phycomyces blakesleeanus NRRL 1555(-)]|eukprot:XP_018288277.1 hypothetical protein PHYBLDRAFT_60139 [Phycomyces blakesleeanus NRRL 1555(-)]